MKALVTGGAGFIGSHLAARLLDEGWSVVVLDDLSNGSEANIPSAAEFVHGSANNERILSRVVPGCDALFHLAAVSSVQDSMARPLEVHAVNVTMTLVLLEAAVRHSVKRFIFSSSSAVYGDTGSEPAREDMKPAPLSHYAVQKLASEHYCSIYRQSHSLETVCLRCFNVYGPGQPDDSPYAGVITRFIAAGRDGSPVTIFGGGSQTRDFVHVDDVVAANVAAARIESGEVAGGVFNIGSGSSVSVQELASMVRRHFPQSGAPVFEPHRLGEIERSCADISCARRLLGFDPHGSLETFLASESSPRVSSGLREETSALVIE